MKKILSLVIALAGCGALMAAPLSPEQALGRLSTSKGMGKGAAIVPGSLTPTYTAKTQAGIPSLYIFNGTGNAGYVVVSADDEVTPLLGYSETGAFSTDRMPEPMKAWIDEYTRQIEWLRDNGLSGIGAKSPVFEEAVTEREAIAPMVTAAWDQIEPYNNLCPLYGGIRTYTGCVATSMAQVMKYWNYPEVGQGSISYNASTLGKRLSLDFSKRPFDWELMRDRYTLEYTDEEADAVAYLMRAAAYSVKMDFTADSSAALSLSIADALVRYFCYDPNTHFAVRALYPTSVWNEMIYENLRTVGPVIYGGTSMMGGGHSFICDGYDGNGYFHFNWGWSGVSDGYFLLDVLNPTNLGSGGGTGGGYNFSQDAVLGIQPPTGLPLEDHEMQVTQTGSLTADVYDSWLLFGLEGNAENSYINYAPYSINVSFGASIQSLDNPDADPVVVPAYSEPIVLKSGYGTSEYFKLKSDLSGLDLADGLYRVTIVTKIAEHENEGYRPVVPFNGYRNYVTVSKQGDELSICDTKLERLHIVDGEFLEDLYFGALVKVKAVVSNDSDQELSCGLAPALYYSLYDESDPSLFFLGKSEYVTVPAHSTVEHVWVTDMLNVTQAISMNCEAEMLLTFYNEATYTDFREDIYKTVTMMPNPGISNVSMTDLTVPDAPWQYERIGARRMKVYYVDDCNEIPVTFQATLSGTVPFYYQMLACLLSSTEESNGSQAIHSYNGEPVFLHPGDEPYTFSTTLSFPYMEPGTLYYLTGAYIYSDSFLPLSSTLVPIRLGEISGVDGIEADEEVSDAPYYNLQGVCVGTDATVLPRGIYVQGGRKVVIK